MTATKARSAGGATGLGTSHTKRRANIRLDMTPMVDIAFLLLIFYMATTQFKPPDARAVTLPTSKSQIDLPAKDVITITVTRADSIFVDFVELVSDEQQESAITRRTAAVDLDGFKEQLLFARFKNPTAFIVIKADAQASFGRIHDITKLMRNCGCQRFLVATDLDPAPVE